jgi:cytochrome c
METWPAMASSLETNKLLAAILTAGVIASGSGVMSRILYGPTFPEEPAYRIEVAVAVDPDAPVEAERPLGVLLAAADPAAGEGQARACVACHTFEAGGPNRVGPNLHDVVGRDIASVPGFNYSATLAGLEGVWDYEALDGFLADPRGWAPGTTMAYAGVRDDAGRADLILYLRSITDDPPPLPEAVEEIEAVVEEAAAAPDGEPAAEVPAAAGLGALVAAADPAAGERAVRACAACHTFDAGGAHRLGPNLHNVVGRDIAGAEGFNFSPALQEIEGVWDDEHLDAFLADPRGYAPGNRMAFAGVRDETTRADIIAYLRSITESPPPLPGDG